MNSKYDETQSEQDMEETGKERPYYELPEYNWPREFFDEKGMLLPGNMDAEITRNERIKQAVWPLFEMCNISDQDVLRFPVRTIRHYLINGRYGW